MRRLDMSRTSAYRKMAKNLKTRTIENKRVLWPDLPQYPPDMRFRARFIDEKDFGRAADFWQKAYPEIYGSSSQYSWMLYQDEYRDRVVTKDNFRKDREEKDFCMIIVEDRDNDNFISGGAVYRKDDNNLQVEFSFGGIHPEYRRGAAGDKLVPMVLFYLKEIEDKSGAEYLSAFCETWHDISQYLCLKVWGWKVAGIFPGQFTRWSHGQEEYRGCTVHFYKLIGEGKEIASLPGDWSILPEIVSLWNELENINSYSRDMIRSLDF